MKPVGILTCEVLKYLSKSSQDLLCKEKSVLYHNIPDKSIFLLVPLSYNFMDCLRTVISRKLATTQRF